MSLGVLRGEPLRSFRGMTTFITPFGCRAALSLSLLTLLAACSSGGGGSTPTTPPPPTNPPPVREARFGSSGVQGPGTWAITTVGIDGNNARTVRTFDHLVTGPRWSPDGRRIAFLDPSDTNGFLLGIYVMADDGTDLRRVAYGDLSLDWHPDSRNLLYTTYVTSNPVPGNGYLEYEGMFRVVDTDTGLLSFSVLGGWSGVITTGSFFAGHATQAVWRGPDSVYYTFLEQNRTSTAPTLTVTSRVYVGVFNMPTLPAINTPRSFGAELQGGAPLGELLLAAHPTLGVMLSERTGITSTDDRLVWLTGGSRFVLHANDGGQGFRWSPDGTMCQWGAFLHRWDTFDPVGGSSIVAMAPAGYWHLAP